MKLNEEKIKSTFTFTTITALMGAFFYFEFVAPETIGAVVSLSVSALLSILAIILFLYSTRGDVK